MSSPVEKRSAGPKQHTDPTLELSDRMIELIAARFRMLGEPMRLRILQVLESGEQAVSQIVTRTGGTQSNVSRHLAALRKVGIVDRRQSRNNALYKIADPMITKICHIVCHRVSEDMPRDLSSVSNDD